MKKIFESIEPIAFAPADNGCALIITNGAPMETGEVDDTNGLIVTVGSWDCNKKHEELKQFEGKFMRITVELLDNAGLGI